MNFDSRTWYAIGTVVAVAALLVFVYISARRFAAKQRRLGRWDQYGPLEETEAPPGDDIGYGYRRYAARSMAERLEVIGRWKGKVLRRREPDEKPDTDEA